MKLVSGPKITLRTDMGDQVDRFFPGKKKTPMEKVLDEGEKISDKLYKPKRKK